MNLSSVPNRTCSCVCVYVCMCSCMCVGACAQVEAQSQCLESALNIFPPSHIAHLSRRQDLSVKSRACQNDTSRPVSLPRPPCLSLPSQAEMIERHTHIMSVWVLEIRTHTRGASALPTEPSPLMALLTLHLCSGPQTFLNPCP